MKKYDKLKKILKDNYKIIILYLILIPLFMIELNYDIYTPGGLINLNNRIKINNNNDLGDINITYVNAKKGVIPLLLLSYIIPDWDVESKEVNKIENESNKEVLERGLIDLNNVNNIATYIAFEAANKEYKITNKNLIVYYVNNNAKTNIKVGDIIKKVNNYTITSMEDLNKIISVLKVNDKIDILVERNNKEKNCYATLIEMDNTPKIGIYIQETIDIKTNPKVEFNYKSNEIGSSGGLMSTLAIYNSITEEDITKGKKIAGTGTIEMDGTIGAIAGIKYKLIGAANKEADVFIVPEENYEEAQKWKEKKNYKIKLIKAINFKQVLNDLNSI